MRRASALLARAAARAACGPAAAAERQALAAGAAAAARGLAAGPRFAPGRRFSSGEEHGGFGGEEWAELVSYPPPRAFVGQAAPDFEAPAVVDGEIRNISLSDYRGKYVVLFFYPKDFTFVCPTEIIAFSDRAKEFEALDCQVIAASTDTEECHLAWIKTPRSRGGLGYMQIPIVADTTKVISSRYGVLLEKAGIALRGLFVINPEGIIQQITINDLPIGRSVEETLRLVQAIQFHAKYGEVCPANWKPGDKTIIADPDRSLEYFEAANKARRAARRAGCAAPDPRWRRRAAAGGPRVPRAARAAQDAAAGGEEFGAGLTPINSRREFEALVSGPAPVVVDFMAPWCGKCRMIAPFVDELAAKHPDMVFAKFDTSLEQLEPLSAELNVKALPVFRFFKGGEEVVPEVVGYKKKPLEAAVERLAAAARLRKDTSRRTELVCTACLRNWRLRLDVSRFGGSKICDCAPGFGFIYNSDCLACPAGQWCPGGGPANPTNAAADCPEGLTTTFAGAKSQAQCTTKPGYGRASIRSPSGAVSVGAVPCEPGTYNGGQNSQQCTRCGIGLTTIAAGSASAAQCVAPPGSFFDARTNTALRCPRGSYSSSFGRAPSCTACPPGTTTASDGAATASACVAGLAN
ncbi:PRDX1 [Scenedesmus sp. PABB004]|nr:PRDX1 [Scenedesmus sp. PABB004]